MSEIASNAPVRRNRSPLPERRGGAAHGLPSGIGRIAVCVSGEFRHVHHRTPEQQLRHLLSFLTGVDCDIFVHGWHNSSEALIVNELRPRAVRFEPRPAYGRLAGRIRHVEPNIKPGRDEGSLAMFHSWQQCLALLRASPREYTHVLRIRPDIFVDLSLLEILDQIERAGVLPGTIYVPHMFHSKGINDQIAFGPIDQMAVYLDTLQDIEATIEQRFFNPETALLHNLVSHGVPIAFADIPYSLMREVPFRINTIHERFETQQGIWWSRTEWLPQHQDLSEYFRQKLCAVDGLMRGTVPELLYARVPSRRGGRRERAVLRLRMIDNDPVMQAFAIHRRAGLPIIGPFTFEDGEALLGKEVARQLLAYREKDSLVLSEWKLEGGVLRNERLTIAAEDNAPTARALKVPIGLALKLKTWRERWYRRQDRASG